MTNACESVVDRLPDRVANRLGPEEALQVDTHLEECAACRAEAELLTLLAADAPTAPPGLEERIQRAVGREFGKEVAAVRASGAAGGPVPHRTLGWRPSRIPAWGWAAAAGLALLLGRGLVPDGESTASGPDLLALTDADVEYGVLPTGDIVAGAPVLDGLTEEVLNQLLEEWDG